MIRKKFKQNIQRKRQRRGIDYMRQEFKKVVYLESVNEIDNNVYEIQEMKQKANGLEIHLTNGEVISGSAVRYARECEQEANQRLPHN